MEAIHCIAPISSYLLLLIHDPFYPLSNRVGWNTKLCFFSKLCFREELEHATLSSVLSPPANKQIFSQLLKRGLRDSNIQAANSALSMFMKSGCLYSARNLFCSTASCLKWTIFTWNTTLSQYRLRQHGYVLEAVMTFYQMLKAGFRPDKVSFFHVFHGCSHGGFVKQGI